MVEEEEKGEGEPPLKSCSWSFDGLCDKSELRNEFREEQSPPVFFPSPQHTGAQADPTGPRSTMSNGPWVRSQAHPQKAVRGFCLCVCGAESLRCKVSHVKDV